MPKEESRYKKFITGSSARAGAPEFETKLLDLARVVHVRAGGKKMSFRAIIVAGNKLGKVGLGVGKGLDVAQAIEKAQRAYHKKDFCADRRYRNYI